MGKRKDTARAVVSTDHTKQTESSAEPAGDKREDGVERAADRLPEIESPRLVPARIRSHWARRALRRPGC